MDREKTDTLTEIQRNNFFNNNNSIKLVEFFKIVKKSFENKCLPKKIENIQF